MNTNTNLREIPGFPFYYVNNVGEIWTNRNGHFKQMSQFINTDGYPCVKLSLNGKRYNKLISRLVINAPVNKLVDHKDFNPLNNNIDNLRFCNSSQNCFYSRKRKNASSKYKGVYWIKNNKKWLTIVKKNGKNIRLGCFENEDDAALAYNKRAKKEYGEFALLNLIKG